MDILTTVRVMLSRWRLFRAQNLYCTCSVSAVNLRECMYAFQPMAPSTGTQASTLIAHWPVNVLQLCRWRYSHKETL